MGRLLMTGPALGASGCAGDLERAARPLEAAFGYGASSRPLGGEGDPVRAGTPSGERDHLRRLRCPDGRATTFDRFGSVAPL